MKRKAVATGEVALFVKLFSTHAPSRYRYRLPRVWGTGDVVFIPTATQDDPEENDMGLFGNMLGKKATAAVQKYSGNLDFLEALCAACALTAAAGDGNIDDKEFNKVLKVIQSNKAVSAGFNAQQIEQAFTKMAQHTDSRLGKSQLKTEIREAIERDSSMGEAIILTCLDVADVGGISAEEEAVMRDIAQICGANYDKLAAG